MSKKLYLLDGTALLYRAFFGLQRTGLTGPGGQPTGAVFGFANTLQFLVDQEKPDYLGVVFDPPGPTFRHEMYPEYKANRAEMPEDLVSQIPPLAPVQGPGLPFHEGGHPVVQGGVTGRPQVAALPPGDRPPVAQGGHHAPVNQCLFPMA